MEEHFTKMLNLDEDQIIRSGYPANMFNKASFSSFDHNIKITRTLIQRLK